MPVYNNDSFLSQAIDSVLTQSFTDFELIIIDDGSKDNSSEIIKNFENKDKRIVNIKNQENRGLIYCLNLGLEKAKGELIARVDSDDWWIDKDKLKKQVGFLENNSEYGLVDSFAKAFDENGREMYNLKYPIEDEEIRKKILIKNCFVHSGVLFRKSVAILNNGYLENEKYVEDYGLWLRIGRKNKFYNMPEEMVGYRISEGGETLKFNIKQIQNSLNLAFLNKDFYPNFMIAKFKWTIKLWLISIFGVSFFGKLKKIILK
jgi:glycosyltransferase involved in cell wall biosynthesis